MTGPSWVSDEIDLSRPSVARVYDYYLGGFHNFEPDRALAQKIIAGWPDVPLIMRSNRAFLRRVVAHLVRSGVRQFLDIGAGIPTVGNVHEVAQEVDPGVRVVYVDIDPVAMAHSRAILAGNDLAVPLPGDMNQPEQLLEDVRAQGLLDLDQPVAVLLIALLHFLPDDADPYGKVATLRSDLAPGSHLVVSHSTHELHPSDLTDTHRSLYAQTATPMTMRTRAQVEGFFDGFELLEPGVVLLEQWNPGQIRDAEAPERFPGWAGVGRLP